MIFDFLFLKLLCYCFRIFFAYNKYQTNSHVEDLTHFIIAYPAGPLYQPEYRIWLPGVPVYLYLQVFGYYSFSIAQYTAAGYVANRINLKLFGN